MGKNIRHGEEPFYLAVDGGGTSTSFTVARKPFDVVLSFTAGPTSFKSVGMKTARTNLVKGVEQLHAKLAECDISTDRVWGTWGMSGCDSEADAQTFRNMLSSCGIDLAHHEVCNDAMLTLRAITMGTGIVVVAGTGSVCLGVDEHGDIRRIGGWGYQFSDLGSGCWIGSRLIQEALLFRDGCRADDPAFARALPLLHDAAKLTRADDIAAFARVALESGESPVCQSICAQAARYLAGYAVSMLHALDDTPCDTPRDTPPPLVLAGGLFKNDAFCRAVVGEITRREPSAQSAICHAKDDSPARGGIKMAAARHARESGGDVEDASTPHVRPYSASLSRTRRPCT